MLLLFTSLLAIAGHAQAQGENYASAGYHRGFPDCQAGPLANTTVCDTAQGLSIEWQYKSPSITDCRPFDPCYGSHQSLDCGREAQPDWF